MKELYPHLNPLKYRKQVEACLDDFRSLEEGAWFPMERIQSWIEKNKEFYTELHHFYYKQLWWHEMDDGTPIRIPDTITTSEDILCNLFSKLEELNIYYSYETKAGNQIELYEETRHNETNLREWVERNKYFFLDMMDKYFHYNSIKPEEGISISIYPNWTIRIHPKYFSNCINLSLIMEHYNEMQYFEWTSDIAKIYLNQKK